MSNLRNLRTVLAELLRLYDWRFKLAKMERLTELELKLIDVKPSDVRSLLREYGAEKKAAWEAAREVLAATPDGHAVVLDAKDAPRGYWFVGAYADEETAKRVLARSPMAKGERIVPIYFGD